MASMIGKDFGLFIRPAASVYDQEKIEEIIERAEEIAKKILNPVRSTTRDYSIEFELVTGSKVVAEIGDLLHQVIYEERGIIPTIFGWIFRIKKEIKKDHWIREFQVISNKDTPKIQEFARKWSGEIEKIFFGDKTEIAVGVAIEPN